MSLRLQRGRIAMAPVGAILVFFMAGTSSAAAPETLSLADALARARRENPTLRAQADGVRAAGHKRDAQKSRYLPIVKVEGNGMLWDSPLEVSLGGGGAGGGAGRRCCHHRRHPTSRPLPGSSRGCLAR